MNTDEFTKELIGKADILNPGKDFTKNVMSQILKDPAVKVDFITEDDKKSNIWLLISLGIMFAGFILFYFLRYGFNFKELTQGFQTPAFLIATADLLSKFWSEVSVSPYILVALIGVFFLVIIDKTIVKYLYSI